MGRAPFRTELGIGWVRFEGERPVEILLPDGEATDAADADPPAAIARLVECLEAYYAGSAALLPAPALVDAAGRTPLLHDIYEVVSAIPVGRTMSYGEVAAAAGRPRAARAVGAAMARNPFAPIIPCHRVVGSDGALHGYGGGLHQKQHLLELERTIAGG